MTRKAETKGMFAAPVYWRIEARRVNRRCGPNSQSDQISRIFLFAVLPLLTDEYSVGQYIGAVIIAAQYLL
jgi:hypothetical protein